MLTSRTINHIRTSRNIRSFQSCPHATGIQVPNLEEKRLAREEERLDVREARRVWLEDQWKEHFESVAGACRALPPAARSQRMKD